MPSGRVAEKVLPTIGAALVEARERLADVSETASYEARLLLSTIIGQPAAWLYAHSELALTPDQADHYFYLIEKRHNGHPLAYLLGTQGFYRWEFAVNEHVLIPRPETELLVEKAHEWLTTHKHASPVIVDVGTGSGIIAISLALLCPEASVFAIDLSPEALRVAQENAEKLGANNVQFLQGDLLTALPVGVKADLIAANLPYIATDELKTLEVARWEPHLALDGGSDGLSLIQKLLEQAPDYLKSGGRIILEIGADQAEAVQALSTKTLPDATMKVQQDLAGRDRLAIMQLPEPR